MKPFNREELRTRVANLLMVRQTRQILQREASIQAQNLVTLASVVARRQRELTLVNAQLLEREAYLERIRPKNWNARIAKSTNC